MTSMKQDEYIILVSNVKSFGETNSISHFKTKLARKRDYSPLEDWRVALTELSYKQTWYNVKESAAIKFIDEKCTKVSFEQLIDSDLEITAGYYPTVNDLITKINKTIERIFEYVVSVPQYSINPHSQIVYLEPGLDKNNVKFLPSLGKEIEGILGLIDYSGKTMTQKIESCEPIIKNKLPRKDHPEFKKLMKIWEKLEKSFTKMKIKAWYPADIKAGFNNLFVYSNIVQMSDVGDTFAPILTTFPNILSKEGWGGSINQESKNLVYRPLQSKYFDTIEISVKDDSGKLIPFKSGNVLLKLHFVNYG